MFLLDVLSIYPCGTNSIVKSCCEVCRICDLCCVCVLLWNLCGLLLCYVCVQSAATVSCSVCSAPADVMVARVLSPFWCSLGQWLGHLGPASPHCHLGHLGHLGPAWPHRHLGHLGPAWPHLAGHLAPPDWLGQLKLSGRQAKNGVEITFVRKSGV